MNKKQIIRNERTNEEYVHVKHPSGLDIYIWRMEGFSTTHAYFGTKYGSINTHFKTKNTDGCVNVPEGVAHFLEHKLFENEDCDVFELYAKTGASGNAYTSFDHTCYLFECSDNYEKSLEILLSFVQKPYFTKESVDKEQGIIAQEIKMCEDRPDRQAFYNVLRAMYHVHPIRIDIAGTVESISHIDEKLLYECYNTFYNLHNMVLSIAGNVDVDEILRICDEQLIPCEDNGLELSFPEEPLSVNKPRITQVMPVGVPIFYIGFKAQPFEGVELAKYEQIGGILLQLMFGGTSAFFKTMLDEKLLNTSFGYYVFCGSGYYSICFCGESSDPDEVQRRIIAEIERVKAEGLDEKQFEMIKKAMYGGFIREFNNVEQNATRMMTSHFAGIDAFTQLEILASTEYKDVIDAIPQIFNCDNSVISIIDNK